MRKLLISLGLAALTAAPAFAQLTAGDLVINEFSPVQSGTDHDEFVEIYNTTAGTIDFTVNPVTVELVNGFNGAVYNSFGINSGSLAAGGFQSVATAGLQNGDPDAIRLIDSVGVLDAVAYFVQYDTTPGTPENAALPATAYEGAGGTGAGGDDVHNHQTGTAAPFSNFNATAGRFPDGADSDDNQSDFDIQLWVTVANGASPGGTAGSTNAAGLGSSTFTEDFSQGSGLLRTWSPSFTPVVLETASSALPASIPDSPDGTTPTDWASVKDGTGGGDQAIVADFYGQDYNVTAQMYVGAGTSSLVLPNTEVGALMARVRGMAHQNNSSGSYDVSTPIGAYGSTWYALEADYVSGEVTAIQNVNGVRTELGSTVIASPGWHEFAIRCEGGIVEYGVDGVRVDVLTGETPVNGYVGIGYRELDGGGAGAVRANFDALEVSAPAPVPVELSVFTTN